jgi:hypothetical protein
MSGANTVGGCYRLKLPDMKRAEPTTISEVLLLIVVHNHVVLIATKKAPDFIGDLSADLA